MKVRKTIGDNVTKKPVNYRIDIPTLEKFNSLAKQLGANKSYLIEEAIKEINAKLEKMI